ncbi:MAG: tryptophan-rich sensory protein [Flavobacteriales bacterium]|nr:tryptophan-rich sensory protein [Flavobacteriales bacterium]
MIRRVILFLVLNFGALLLGGLLMNGEVTGDWYLSLNKAPWTPPGWVFGAAWTTIMLCFTIYMTLAWEHVKNKRNLLILFGIQWVLNVFWNPVFFALHYVAPGLVIIMSLTLLVGYFLIGYLQELSWKVLFVVPYFAWLLVATSLNAYILLYN